MTADLPSRRVSERVEPWTTPVAPINWTHRSSRWAGPATAVSSVRRTAPTRESDCFGVPLYAIDETYAKTGAGKLRKKPGFQSQK